MRQQQVHDFVGASEITDEQCGRIFHEIIRHSSTPEQVDELCDALGINQWRAIAWAHEIKGDLVEDVDNQDDWPQIVSEGKVCPACGSRAWRADMGVVDCQCCGLVCEHKWMALIVDERDGRAVMTCSDCGCEVDK
jgi:hypothetical protein